MTIPPISIVIPSYNLARFLPEAIESALAQTLRPTDVVVVDDGSTDESVAVASRYAVTLIQQKNGGVARARNAGAAAVKGAWLAFLDADDVLCPEYLERCARALARSGPEVAYAYTDVEYFGEEAGVVLAYPFDAGKLTRGNFVHATALLRRDVLVEVGGWNESWKPALEDYELWIRMLDHGYVGTYVPGALLRYRRRAASRNSVEMRVVRELMWKLSVRYPKLYWKRLAIHAVRALAARWDVPLERKQR